VLEIEPSDGYTPGKCSTLSGRGGEGKGREKEVCALLSYTPCPVRPPLVHGAVLS
jgi:hypothetical protein